MRDETDLNAWREDLVEVVREAMQPPTSRCGCAPTHHREEAKGESRSPRPATRPWLTFCAIALSAACVPLLEVGRLPFRDLVVEQEQRPGAS